MMHQLKARMAPKARVGFVIGAGLALAIVGAVALSPAQKVGDVIYMRRDGTAITQGPTASSGAVTTLDHTQPMTVVETDGRAFKVRLRSGQEGWVSKLRITDTAPGRRGLQVANDAGPAERSNVSAVRGLSPIADEYVASGAASEAAKAQTEQIIALAATIGESEVRAFAQQGGVEPK